MDKPSGSENPSPEPLYIRPPGLEMGRGLAIFSLVFAVFAMAQMCLLIERVITLTPSFSERGLTSGLLEDPAFQERWQALSRNGDVVAGISLWAGVIGLVLLLVMVRAWKRGRTASFLGMQLPLRRSFLAWVGLFIVFFAALEVIARLIPGMESAFMSEVLGSVTNYPLLVIGVGLMPAFFEEVLFRGLLFGSLRYVMDKNAAIALVAGLFTLVHPQYSWQLQLFYMLPMSVFLGYARANTGSIWTGVFLHALNNCLSVVLPQP